MSDVRSEVSEALADYAKSLGPLGKAGETAGFYYLPMIFISNEGVENFTDSVELENAIKHYNKWLKERRYARVEVSDSEISVLNSSHAASMFELIGYDKGGAEVGRFDGTYAWLKDEQGKWRIVVATLLTHSELNELNH